MQLVSSGWNVSIDSAVSIDLGVVLILVTTEDTSDAPTCDE